MKEIIFQGKDISRGLRPTKRMPRDTMFLIDSQGCFPRDGVIQAVETLSRIDTSTLGATFPYPQIYIGKNRMYVFDETTIYEWDGSSLTSVKSGLTAGVTWSVLDYYDYALFSNGKVVVERDANGNYTVTTDYPTFTAACDFNGQAIIGAPDVEASGNI